MFKWLWLTEFKTLGVGFNLEGGMELSVFGRGIIRKKLNFVVIGLQLIKSKIRKI